MISSAPPTSFVPADDDLFAPVAHGSVWLALGVAALAAGVALAVWGLRRAVAPDTVRTARLSVKERYLADVDELQIRYAERHIDERQLHHALSAVVRRFAAEHGTPDALAMTPTELDSAGLVGVAGVVATYQPPQFMELTTSDPPASLDAARAVIRQW